MVVDHSCQQVVGRADRVEVTCEVQVDILHGNYLCITAAGCAALDTKDRSQGGLTKGYHDLFAQLLQSVRKADGCCGLAFAGRRGVHRCHEDQLSVVSLGVLEKFVVDLGLVFAVLFQILVTDARFLCDLCDREHLTFLRNFNIALVAHSLIPFLFWCVLSSLSPIQRFNALNGKKKDSSGNLLDQLHYQLLPRRSTYSVSGSPVVTSTNPSVTRIRC